MVEKAQPAPDIEQFDQLLPYLRAQGVLARDEPVLCERLAGGVSNKTVRIARRHGPNLVIKQALPKLRVPVDWFSSPQRIHREYAALRLFDRLLPQTVPQAVFQDRACHVIGMTEVPRPYVNWKTEMMQGHVSLPHWQRFGQLLARIHGATAQKPQALPEELQDRVYFRSLRLEPYYEYTGTTIAAARPFLTALVRETLAHRLALVHGDYSPKNVLLADKQLFLLDFEVCHVGDPAFDVGFALTHALSKGHRFPHKRRCFQQAAQQFWQAYAAAARHLAFGPDFEARCMRHTLACLLARAAGRSPLEYLDPQRKSAQIQTVLALLAQRPASMPQLMEAFLAHVHDDADLAQRT